MDKVMNKAMAMVSRVLEVGQPGGQPARTMFCVSWKGEKFTPLVNQFEK